MERDQVSKTDNHIWPTVFISPFLYKDSTRLRVSIHDIYDACTANMEEKYLIYFSVFS